MADEPQARMMMAGPTVTLEQLVDRCLAYGYGTVDRDTFRTHINQAYMQVANAFKWDWLQAQALIKTLPGIPVSDLPADFKIFGRLQPVTGTDNWYVPEYMDEMDFRSYSPLKKASVNLRAQPQFFSLWDGQIHWKPVPDDEYVYGLFYWAAPQHLEQPDVTRIPDHDVDVLVVGALRNAAMRENNLQKQSLYSTQYEAMMEQMMRNQKAKQMQKRSRVDMPETYAGQFDDDIHGVRRWYRR